MRSEIWMTAALLLVLPPPAPTRPSGAGAASGVTAAVHDAVILQEELSIEVRSITDARERYHRRVQVLTPRGVEEFDSDETYYMPGVSIVRFEGSVTLPSGKILKAGKSNVVDAPALASFELYSDFRQRVMTLPGVVPGAVIDFSYEKSLRNLFFLPDAFFLQADVPVKLKTLTVTTVPGVPVRFSVKGASPEYTREEKPGSVTHRWQVRDVAGFKVESDAIPVTDLLPRIELTPTAIDWFGRGIDVSSWDGVARFYWELASGRIEPGPEVAGAARSLTAGAQDPAEKVRRVFEYVQGKVNYVAIALGIGGWQPHASSDVLRYRYGDCKDKATLMLAMMRALDLQGWPVLINTRDAGRLDPEMPVVGFNHVIVAVPSEGGRLLLDPTSTTTEYGDLPWQDQGASALIVKPDGTGEFLTTALSSPERNGRRFEVTAYVGLSGNLEGTLVMGVRGQRKAELVPLLSEPPTRQREWIGELLAEFVSGAQVRNLRIDQAAGPGEEMRVTIEFTVAGFLTRAGDMEFLRPHVVRLTDLPLGDTPAKRSQPVFLPYQFSDLVESRVYLPPGRAPRKLPDEMRAQAPGLAAGTRYELSQEKGRNILSVKRFVSAGRREIPPEEYAAYRAFLSALAEDESRAVTLTIGQ
jgi:transglutaminase-like putative cysteine protease